MDLTIIIVNYNTNQLICDCIRSIYKETTNLHFEIIVVDNASQQDPTIVKEIFPQIKLIINNSNEGFGKANNIGIKAAKGKYVLLLNSDTIILNGGIEKCYNFMESQFAFENNIGLLGCTLLNNDSTFQHSTFGKENIHGYLINGNPILGKIKRFLNKNNTKFDFNQGQMVVGISGAFMFFRAEVFKKISPFDPDIFMYSEETELCRRRVNKLYNIYYWPGAQVLHYGTQSGIKEVMHHQNMLSYALTWYKKGFTYYLLYILYSFINFFLLLSALPLANQKVKKEIKGVLRGYKTILPHLLFDIPKFSKHWGSRKEPLKLKSLK